MTRHLKRQAIPRTWPIARKGTAYLVNPKSDINDGVPMLIALRDMLKLARNRKEVKKAIQEKKILINNFPAKGDKQGLTLFDKITITPLNKTYSLMLNKLGKYCLEEDKDPTKKVAKIINKTQLRNKKIQINLNDGNNFLSEEKCKTNDSVIIDWEKKKITKIIPLKEGAKIVIFAGKHTGEFGILKNIDSDKKMVEAEIEGKNIRVLIKQIMAVN